MVEIVLVDEDSRVQTLEPSLGLQLLAIPFQISALVSHFLVRPQVAGRMTELEIFASFPIFFNFYYYNQIRHQSLTETKNRQLDRKLVK
jgi:hypothetical protein